jgi:thiol-disulfide isomerase/thioredoxin
VVRDVFSTSTDSLYQALFFNEVALPERTKELFTSAEEVRKLSGNITSEIVEELSVFTKSLQNRDFAEEIDLKISQASKLLPGQPAIDFTLTDIDGNTMRLSDFKGKVLYIDLWATWCGPCIQESPFYESLSAKFNPEEILFMPVSTDKNSEVWLEYLAANSKQLKQYHSVDVQLVEGWNLQFIPRFLLIDKDFNIVNAYAPRSSDEGTEALLNSLLD